MLEIHSNPHIIRANRTYLCHMCKNTNIVTKADGLRLCLSCGSEPNEERPVYRSNRLGISATTTSSRQANVSRVGQPLQTSGSSEDEVRSSPESGSQQRYALDDLRMDVEPIREGNIPSASSASVADVASLFLRNANLRKAVYESIFKAEPHLTINGFSPPSTRQDALLFNTSRLVLERSELQVCIALVFLTFCRKRKNKLGIVDKGNVTEALSIMDSLLGRRVSPGVLLLASRMCNIRMDIDGKYVNNPYLYLLLPSRCIKCLEVRFKAGYKASPERRLCHDCRPSSKQGTR